MSPLELKTAESFRISTGIDKSKTIEPGNTERISLGYFGVNDTERKGKVSLEASCEEDDENGAVTLIVEKEDSSIIKPKVYKLKRGGPKQYISKEGYRVIEMKMTDPDQVDKK